MDPVSQTLAQQQSGSAEGQGFGQFYLAGQQNRNERDRLNLATQHLKLQEKQESRLQKHDDLIDPIMAEYYKGQAAHLGIETKAKTLQYQTAVEYDAALPEIYQLQNDFLNSPLGHADPELRQRALYLSTIYPKAFAPGSPGSDIWTQMESAPMFQARMQRILEAEQKFKGTGIVPSQFDKAGMPTGFVREQSSLPSGIQGTEYLDKLRQDFEAETDPARKAELGKKLETANSILLKSPSSQVVYDNQGNKIFESTTGKQPAQPGDLTTSNLTEIQKKSMDTDAAMNSLNKAVDAIEKNPGSMGLVGKGRELYEQAKGQLGSEDAQPITDTRHKAGLAFSDIAKSLRVDSGNMSRYELAQLERIGDLTDIENSTVAALSKAANLKNALIGRKLRYLSAMKAAPQDNLLRQIPSSEITQLVLDGLLSKQDAGRWYDLNKKQ